MKSQPVVVVVVALCLAGPVLALDVPATIRDFAESHPDFEDDNGTDRGIVKARLGADKKPVYNGGDDGTDTTTGPDEFAQWYNDTPGVNRSRTVFLPLTQDADGRLVFESDAFFPIDHRGFGNEGNDHNFHFTTEVHLRFTYLGGETFEFDGDDDVYVFINGTLALDLGGVHSEQSADVDLDDRADELDLVVGDTYDLDLFHAERKLDDSNFKLTTSIALEVDDDDGQEFADVNGDGVRDDEQDLPGDGQNDLPDANGDGIPDGCSFDDDDGVTCPPDTHLDLDGDGVPDELDEDRDGDGIANSDDDDQDGDGIPDDEDDDIDGDGVDNDLDQDRDGDGVRNADDDTPFGEFSDGPSDDDDDDDDVPPGCGCAQGDPAVLLPVWIGLLALRRRRR